MRRAKKSYGQHFLVSPTIAAEIAQGLEGDEAYDFIVEIGPGQGALTKFLLDHPQDVLAIEADASLIPVLRNEFDDLAKFHLVHANFLSYDITKEYSDKTFALIGNFPYNISSQIIFSLIDYRNQCPVMVGMFQKELADRLISPPGNKTYGAISALVQLFYSGTRLIELEPEAFDPPPKVKSTVIKLTRRTDSPSVDLKKYRQVVKTAFGQRRKKMRNSIGHLFHPDVVDTNAYFSERPEQLGVDDFVELVSLLS